MSVAAVAAAATLSSLLSIAAWSSLLPGRILDTDEAGPGDRRRRSEDVNCLRGRSGLKCNRLPGTRLEASLLLLDGTGSTCEPNAESSSKVVDMSIEGNRGGSKKSSSSSL